MADQPCILGKTINVRGSVAGSEDLLIHGRLEGSVSLTSHLTVEPTAVVEADVDAEAVTVRGSLRGNVRASQTVTIESNGQLVGNVEASRFAIEEGALFSGRVEMDVPLPDGVRR